jgi:hypothetical protein
MKVTIPLIMNVQSEKLQLIEWLVQLQDLNILQRIKEVKQDAEVAAYEASLKPMSVDELVARAEESNRAIEAGEVIDVEDILLEIGE